MSEKQFYIVCPTSVVTGGTRIAASGIRHLDAKALNLAKLIAAEEINNLS